MKIKSFKILCYILSLVLVLSPVVIRNYASVTWSEWQNVPNQKAAMFWDNYGQWDWNNNKYTVVNSATSVNGNYLSLTDFGTGLGVNLTNYKVRFKTKKPVDGEPAVGFQIGSSGFFADGVNGGYYLVGFWSSTIVRQGNFTPNNNDISWSEVGNPAAGDEIVVEITVQNNSIVIMVNGNLLVEENNTGGKEKGFFGLGNQFLDYGSQKAEYYDIQYAIPYVAPAATPTSAPASTPANSPSPAAQPTSTPVPEIPSGEAPSASISTKDITIIEVEKDQIVEITSSSKYPYPGFWEESKQIWLNLQSGDEDKFPPLVAPNPDNNPAIVGGAGISIDSNQQFYYFNEYNSPGNVPPLLGNVSGGNGQFGKFTITNGQTGTYTKIMSVVSPSGDTPWPAAGKPFVFGGYYNLSAKIDGASVSINNPNAIIIKWVENIEDDTELESGLEEETEINSSNENNVSESDSNISNDSLNENETESNFNEDNGNSDNTNTKLFLIPLFLVLAAGVGTFLFLKKKGILNKDNVKNDK